MVESENDTKQNGGDATSDDRLSDQNVVKVVKKKAAKKKSAKKQVVKKKVAKKAAKKKTAKKKAVSKKKVVKKTSVIKEGSPGTEAPAGDVAEAAKIKIQLVKETPSAALEKRVEETAVQAVTDEQAEKYSQPESVTPAEVRARQTPGASVVEPVVISPEISKPEEVSSKTKKAEDQASEGKIVTAELIIKNQSNKEDEHMASTSNGSTGFMPKVIFWLLIVIIGFMYIRSLAKHPGSETGAVEQVQSSVMSSQSETASGQPANEQATIQAAGTEASNAADSESVAEAQGETTSHAVVVDSAEEAAVPTVMSPVTEDTQVAEEPASETSADEQAAEKADVAAPAVGESPVITEAAESQAIATEQTTIEPAVSEAEKAPAVSSAPVESIPEPVESTQAAPVADSPVSNTEATEATEVPQSKAAAAPATPDKPYSQQRSESATQILKEFDELRKAAEAERKAMYEMMQKRREMRKSMMQRPAYPRWNNQDYPARNPYPQGYLPYGYPQ